MGDFNLDLLQYNHNTPTQEFIDTLFSFAFIPLISNPTRLGEIIPRVWTRVRVRVEDRVRLRVRLRVGFRVGFRIEDRVRLRFEIN